MEKMWLLSSGGERHEDRLPKAIFSSEKTAKDYVLKNYGPFDEHQDSGDYGPMTLLIEKFVPGDEVVDWSFVLEAFDVDPAEKVTRRVMNDCNGCGKPLDPANCRIADGCPCNSPRGINHGSVARETCTCIVCDPGQSGSSRSIGA
jgi:hypothetical protein